MSVEPTPYIASAWIRHWFAADQARKGGIIRRNRSDVEKFASLHEVIKAARDRRWHVVENGGQVIILCNAEGVAIHC